MSGFLEAVAKVGKFSLRWDDDFFDRCSHRYTVIQFLCSQYFQYDMFESDEFSLSICYTSWFRIFLMFSKNIF